MLVIWGEGGGEELDPRIENPIQRNERPLEAYPRRGYTKNQWCYSKGNRASGRDSSRVRCFRCDKVRHYARDRMEEIKRLRLNKTCKEYSQEFSGAWGGRSTNSHLKAWKGNSRRQ
jgi:hypothetical protein